MCGIVFCVMAVTRLQRNMNREREDEEITGKLAANLFSNLIRCRNESVSTRKVDKVDKFIQPATFKQIG